ncbi:MAG: ParB/RepB/Spo0J family partition protein [Flavobacteriales bacterium]|nr:ParB/RepB/Spo0J family partition protein [Flavobacteriales bacterium]
MRIENAKMRHVKYSEESTQVNSTRPSVFTEKFRGEYYNIDVEKLIPFHKQARKYFNEIALEQLAETIKLHGVRQPLTIIATEDVPGRYEVISGERRLRAAIMIGLKTVPCIIIHDKKAAVEIALIENVQREDLHALELAKAYQQFLEEGLCENKTEIAAKLSISKSVVTEIMQLLTLPNIIQTQLLEQNITSRSLFRDLLDEKEITKMLSVIEKYKNDKAENKTSKATPSNRKKTVFKVMLSLGEVIIDNKVFNKLSLEEKNKIKESILKIL